jgi:predicted nucleic acid-binding protein
VVLVDTSVWVGHLRTGQTGLEVLLNKGDVASHPFVIGELACGSLKNRTEILSLLQALPVSAVAESHEILELIEARKLMNRGFGYVDVNLLASALLTATPLWTLDKRLDEVAGELGVKFDNVSGR